jgi:DNA-binding transcriptional LysR family regulator
MNMEWSNCVEAFIKVAENQSFAKAAMQLHTTSSSVSKKIQWLEKHTGASLLLRTTRSVELTTEGKQLLTQATPILQEWKNLKDGTLKKQEKIAGILRIASAPYFGRVFLIPAIQRFQKKHPEISVEYYESNQAINLIEQQIDVYIGLGDLIKDPATTIAITLKEDRHQCYAAPSYLKKHGTPRNPNELKNHQCLVMHSRKTWQLNDKNYSPKPHFSCSSSGGLLEAARLGMGIAYLPSGLIGSFVQKNQLEVILPNYQSKNFKLYACYSNLPFQPERTKSFIDFFREEQESKSST